MKVISISIDESKEVKASLHSSNILPIFFGWKLDRYLGKELSPGKWEWRKALNNKLIKSKTIINCLDLALIQLLKEKKDTI